LEGEAGAYLVEPRWYWGAPWVWSSLHQSTYFALA